jgi:drug/metabolite transporter (DMT)-like permease
MAANMTDSAAEQLKTEQKVQSGSKAAQESSAIGYLAVLAATACWGLSGIFVRFVADSVDVTALSLAFWRDTFAFAVLFTGVRLFRPEWLSVKRRDMPWLVAMGASLGIFHVFWNLGVTLNGPAVATVQQAAMPAIVAVAAWAIWREALTWVKIAAIILTFIGTVLVSRLSVLSEAEISVWGAFVGLGIPFTYAAWNLFGKKVRGEYGSFTILTYAFGFGAVVLFPWQLFTPQPWPIPTQAWIWFAGLILVSTTLPFVIYTFGLGKLPASVATILAMTEIPIVAVYSYLLLGESLTGDQVVGAVLVIGGVLLLSWRRPRRARRAG